MTATTTWDPAVGGGYLPKTVTVFLPPLTVRSAADGEEYVMVLPAAFFMGLVMVTVFPSPTKLRRAIGGLTCALAAG